MSGVDAVYVERLSTGWQKPISEPRRFAMLVLSAHVCICTAFIFAFNLISGELQTRYNLDQRDLSTIGTVGIVVSYFVLPYAFIYDHFGPLPIFVLGTLFFPLGSVLLALTFHGIVVGTVVRLSVFKAIMDLGSMLLDLAIMMSIMSHFPISRGPVVAIMKTYAGLGSAIVGTFQLAFFNNKPDHFFYFLMAYAFVVGILSCFFVQLPSYHLTGYQVNHLSVEEKERRLTRKAVYLRQKPPTIRFAFGIVFVVILIIFLPLQGALVTFKGLGTGYRVGFAAVVIVVIVIYPMTALPLRCLDRRESGSDTSTGPGDASKGEDTEQAGAGKSKGMIETDVDFIAPQYQGTFLRNLLTVRLWILLWSFFVLSGASFVIIFNARFILAALSGEAVGNELGTLLTIFQGVGSAVGRLFMSGFEVWTQKRKAEDRIPITASLFIPPCLSILTLVLLLVLPKPALPLPYFFDALSTGVSSAIILLVTRTIFAKDSGKHYNFCFVGPTLSVIVMNRVLYGEWYTREAQKHGEIVCLRRSCVLMPLLFLIGLCVTTFLTSAYFHIQYSRFSKRVLEERRRIREAAMRNELPPDTITEEMSNEGANARN